MSRAVTELDPRELRDHLNDFASSNTDVGTVSTVLSALYEDQSFLSELLTEYYRSKAVFYALVEQDNAPLLAHLYTIQPDILTLSLQLTAHSIESSDTLISIAFKGNHPKILAWLKEHQCPYVVEYKKTLNDIKDKVLRYIQKGKYKELKNWCDTGSCDEIDMLFSSIYAADIVAAADTAGDDYLACLAKTSVTILRVQLEGQSVLDLLCSYPQIESYADALRSIKACDTNDLTEEENKKLDETIESNPGLEDVHATTAECLATLSEDSLAELKDRAIRYITQHRLDKLRDWSEKQSTETSRAFFKSPHAQDVFKVAFSQDPSYVACLVAKNVSALRVHINNSSVFDIVCYNALLFKDALNAIIKHYPNKLTHAEHHQLNLAIHWYNQACQIQRSQPIHPLLTDELFLAALTRKINGKIQLTHDEESLLTTYIDPNLWPENGALDTYLHRFFGPLTKRNLILTPTMSGMAPIDLTYLAQLASGEALACITSMIIDHGVLPQPELKNPNIDMVAYALIPVAIDNHYLLLAIDLSATVDGIYRPGPRNYCIEPYASHVPLPATEERLATLLAPLFAHKDFSLTTIRLNQQSEASVCCYYLIAAICRAVIEGEDFLKYIANTNLDDRMIRAINLSMVTTLGFDYFKLQLPTHLKQLPEHKLQETFAQLIGIMTKIESAETETKKAPEKRKFNFHDIDSTLCQPKRASAYARLSVENLSDSTRVKELTALGFLGTIERNRQRSTKEPEFQFKQCKNSCLTFAGTEQGPFQVAAEADDSSDNYAVIGGNFNT